MLYTFCKNKEKKETDTENRKTLSYESYKDKAIYIELNLMALSYSLGH